MKKTLFLFFVLGSIVSNLLASNFTVVPYVAIANYKDKYKDDALLGGVYAKLSMHSRAYEFAYENTSINSVNSQIKSIKKSDYTFLYSYSFNNNYKVKGGIHLVISNNTTDDDVQSYFTSFEYFQKNRFSLGLDAYYSFYSQSELGREVLQLKPYYGFKFGDYSSTMGTFFTKFSYYHIYFMEKIKATLSRSYLSYEVEINHHKNNFYTKFKAWTGKQVYAVRDNGFTVYNLYEKHKGGWSLSSKYAFNDKLGLRASYINEVYSNIGTTSLSYTDTYLLSGEYSF